MPTVLWAREPEVVAAVNDHHENPLFLAGVALPDAMTASGDLSQALAGAELVVSAVPTQFIREVLSPAAGAFRSDQTIISVSKGIEVTSLLTPHRIIGEVVGEADRVVALSGPSFAHEVASDQPTAVVAASSDAGRARVVQDLLSTDYFRVYASDDIVGAELGGALKNVIALATGIADGLGLARSSRAALLTRGLAEITRLSVASGGNPATCSGLSGLGDLVLTCTSDLSRNRRLGLALGRGEALADILQGSAEVAEGVPTTDAAHRLSSKLGIDMPITEQVYQVLYEGKEPREVILDLMRRSLRDERG